MTWLLRLIRRYDVERWQMLEALGHPIPAWVDRRWPGALEGNGGRNPHRCGTCEARKRWPQLFEAHEAYKVSQERLDEALERLARIDSHVDESSFD